MGREKPTIEQFPFMSIVAVKNTATKNSWMCSGSLIDENFVAIGAQCLYKDGWDVSQLKIKVGVGKSSFESEDGQWIKEQRIIT